MTDTVITQVEAAFKAVLEAYAPLAGVTVITDRPSDDNLQTDELPAIVIWSTAPQLSPFENQAQELVRYSLMVEATSSGVSGDAINRKNLEYLGHVIGALHQDRTLGGKINDAEEGNMAAIEPRSTDAGSASLEIEIELFTPRGNFFAFA